MKKILWLILLSLFVLTSCGGNSWQEQYDLGMRYLDEGNYEEAIIAFDKAIEIDPKQPLAYVGRADTYIASGETESNLAVAFDDYTAAIKLDETNAYAWLGLADVYIRQGEYDKAQETLKEALEKTGNNELIIDGIEKMKAGKFFDSSGNMRRESLYGSDGKMIGYVTHEYNTSGQTISATSYNAQNQQTGHVDYEYDANNRLVVGAGVIFQTATVFPEKFEYDARGNMVKREFFDKTHHEEVLKYDSNDNLIQTEIYLNGELRWVEKLEYIDDKLVKSTMYEHDGFISSYETFEYDGDKLVRRNIYVCDGLSGEATLGSYDILTYDKEGRQIGYYCYDSDGSLIAGHEYE